MFKFPKWFGVIRVTTTFALYLIMAMMIIPSIQSFRMGYVISGVLVLVLGLWGILATFAFVLGFILLGPSRILDKFR